MNENTWPFIVICGGLLVFLLAVSFFSPPAMKSM